MKKLLVALLFFAAPCLAQQPDSVPLNTPLVADLSQDTVEIHASFNGAQLLVFGARNQPGDLVIAIRGPARDTMLRRKERIAGMWMQVAQEKYPNLPLFYAYAATRPLAQVAPPATLRALGLGEQAVIGNSNPHGQQLFDDALVDYFARYHLWQLPFSKISFFGESLFKAKINLPDRLPGGKFTVETYLFDHGQLVGFQTIPLLAYKTGFDARVYDLAQHRPLLFGISAILMALAGGWLAHRIFNRR